METPLKGTGRYISSDRPMLLRTAFAFALIATAPHAFEAGQVIEGRATAKDGDGVVIDGVEVRMQGVAAPEDNAFRVDPGGPAATRALAGRIDGEIVQCELDGTQARGRPVGICFHDGDDLGALLIRQGYARDCPRYSGGRYRSEELQARQDGRDLSTAYELPGYCTR